MVYCILGPLEHFWSSSKCSLFGNYYDIYFWGWVTPSPSQRKKIQNFLLSPIFSEFSRFRIKSYMIKLIRYHLPTIVKHFLAHQNDSGVSGNSRSRSFPRMEASDSRSRTLGMDFFIPFPFPNFGNVFFHSLPVPEFWEWIFSFPSRSQTLGMEIFHSLPVPELTISKSGIKRENGRL